MIYHVKQVRCVPGMILVLPEVADRADAEAGVEHQKDSTQTSVALVVDCVEEAQLPPVYMAGDGTKAYPPVATYRRQVRPGDTITYRRAASQAITLIDDEDQQREYRMIHRDDVTAWIVTDEELNARLGAAIGDAR